jgi:hypothetical protein
MIAGRGIIQPHPQSCAKLLNHCGIAARIQIMDDPSNGVKWEVVDAKHPYIVFNVFHMLLMRLRCKDGLEEPPPIVNLVNVTTFLKGSNSVTHYWNFLWAVLNFLTAMGCKLPVSITHL